MCTHQNTFLLENTMNLGTAHRNIKERVGYDIMKKYAPFPEANIYDLEKSRPFTQAQSKGSCHICILLMSRSHLGSSCLFRGIHYSPLVHLSTTAEKYFNMN